MMSFELQVARERKKGIRGFSQFGRNEAVTTTERFIWIGAATPYLGRLQAASALRIRAGGNVNDTAAGTGARSVTIIGLDENWNAAEETIATNGVSVSAATTTTFLRLNHARVQDVGAYGGENAGGITVETTAGIEMCLIGTGVGQTQVAAHTVPAGKTGYLYAVRATVEAAKAVTVSWYQVQNADDVTVPFTGRRLIHRFAKSEGQSILNYVIPIVLPAKTDLYATAFTETGTSAVGCTFDMILVDDGT